MNRGCLLAIAIVVAFWIAFALFVVSAIAAPRPAPETNGEPIRSVLADKAAPRLGLGDTQGRTGASSALVVRGGPEPTVTAQAAMPPSIIGTATWYRAPSIRDAAAGPALRVGHWRGSTVTVCASECVTVRLTDWCACPHHLIDLDSRAFRRLAPLSAGVVRVTILVGGLPIAPQTDIEEAP